MAEINMQWKNTDACYDFYCPCNPEEPQHRDGYFKQWFTCGDASGEGDVDLDPDLIWCGKTWWLPNRVEAVEVSGPGVWPSTSVP